MKDQILNDIETLEVQAVTMMELFSMTNSDELKDAIVHWATTIIGYSQGATYLHASELSAQDVKEIADRQEAAITVLAKLEKIRRNEKCQK